MNTLLLDLAVITIMTLAIALLIYLAPKCLEYSAWGNIGKLAAVMVPYIIVVFFSEIFWGLATQGDTTTHIPKMILINVFMLSPIFSTWVFVMVLMKKGGFDKIHKFSEKGIKRGLVFGPIIGLIVGLITALIIDSATVLVLFVVLGSILATIYGWKKEFEEQ